MPEPLFDKGDRVPASPSGSVLPKELEGKSAEEVAQYYQRHQADLERQIMDARRQPAPQPPAPKTADDELTNADIWANPKEAFRKLAAGQGVTREEYARSAEFVKRNLTETAQLIIKQRHADYPRFEREVQTIMAAVDDWQRADPNMWEMAYTQVKGLKVDELVAEAETRVKLSAEPVNPAPRAPEPPRQLTAVELKICENMNITPERYLQAQKNMEDGKWPLTMSNVGARQ